MSTKHGLVMIMCLMCLRRFLADVPMLTGFRCIFKGEGGGEMCALPEAGSS